MVSWLDVRENKWWGRAGHFSLQEPHQLHSATERKPKLSLSVLDSTSPVKELHVLSTVLYRLHLQGKAFEVFTPAQDGNMEQIWSCLTDKDPSLQYWYVHRQSSLRDLNAFSHFLTHWSSRRHHWFNLIKSTCTIVSCQVMIGKVQNRIPVQRYRSNSEIDTVVWCKFLRDENS